MTVLRLVKRSNSETVELLECMLALARIGELEDVETTYTRRGVEYTAFTGRYRSSSAEALRAAFRMSILLTRQESTARGNP